MDTLATALYVKTDDLLKESPQLAPYRPKTGIGPKLAGAELVTLAVMQALMGFTPAAKIREGSGRRASERSGGSRNWKRNDHNGEAVRAAD